MTYRPWATLSRRARIRSGLAPPRASTTTPARQLTSTRAPSSDADAEPQSAPSYRTSGATSTKPPSRPTALPGSTRTPRRRFHNYFITHLPSSSMHPDRRHPGPGHGLPRDASTPHTPGQGHSPASITGPGLPRGATADLTVVRIPLRSAKHHFGSATGRGTRAYNEDSEQAGTIDMPAFAKRAPVSLVRRPGGQAEVTPADSSFGDPQIFYFAVFDGHGGSEGAQFLKDELHGYIEEASGHLGLLSSLGKKHRPGVAPHELEPQDREGWNGNPETPEPAEEKDQEHRPAIHGSDPIPARIRDYATARQKFADLVGEYKDTVGGYFRRFQPEHFPVPPPDPEAEPEPPSALADDTHPRITVESVLEYAFLRADLDFISAQAQKPDPQASEAPIDSDDVLGLRAPHTAPSGRIIGGRTRFKGGSTATVALLSTPTPAPFWHPNSHATLMVAHVGDTRAILCDTATGLAVPVTSDHHPTSPAESKRLRRYAPAAELVSGDSFGEQRISGLANSRAFGDVSSKRVGVSAEPEITRVDITPAQYSFLVLCSDGVSGTLSDQEIVDTVKEAATPAQGATDVMKLATEISSSGDNATCQVVRLGGWERRVEGGLGSLGTKEVRELRRADAADPRRGKQ